MDDINIAVDSDEDIVLAYDIIKKFESVSGGIKKSVLKFASTEWITKQKSQTVISRKIDPS